MVGVSFSIISVKLRGGNPQKSNSFRTALPQKRKENTHKCLSNIMNIKVNLPVNTDFCISPCTHLTSNRLQLLHVFSAIASVTVFKQQQSVSAESCQVS